MKKEFIKLYIEWPKLASFNALKNSVVLRNDPNPDTYSIFSTERIPFWHYKGPYYEQQIFTMC